MEPVARLSGRGDDSWSASTLAPADLFTSDEEQFLRCYSTSLNRLEAMMSAGLVPGSLDVQRHAEVMRQAGGVIARAERLSFSALASCLGADRIAFISHVWRCCQDPDTSKAIKGLMLLGKIHGLFAKEQPTTQVALVFTQPQQPTTQAPADLPFTLSSEDYRMFHTPQKAPDTENERAS